MSVLWLVAVAGWVLYEPGRWGTGPRGARPGGVRRWCWYGAAVLLALIGEPPLAVLAHDSLWAETLQFGVLAFGVVPLAVISSPGLPPAARRWLAVPRIRPRALSGMLALGCFLTVTIGWRVPPAVGAVASGRGWLALETVTVLAGSWWLWAVLTGTTRPTFAQPRPGRVALGAVATWSVWIFAYVLGFSAHPFYPAFAAGSTPVAAQEVAVGVLLATSALGFCPVLFANLTRWLGTDQAEAEAEMAGYGSAPAPARGGAHD